MNAILQRFKIIHFVVGIAFAGTPSIFGELPANFGKDSLVAWCVVHRWDTADRSPAERAVMLSELGVGRLAYNWTQQDNPQFEEEILQCQKYGIEYFAFWNENEEAFRLGLESWRQVAGLESKEERIESIRPANDLLAHLSFRCFPTFRPVIAGYLKILSGIADGKPDEVEEVSESFKESRLAAVVRQCQTVELSDWYRLSIG